MKTLTLSYTEISEICLELSLFLHSGANSSAALVLLAEDCEDTARKEQLLQMAQRIDEGLPLSSAMEKSGLFPKDVCTMVHIGEQSGRCEEALNSLSHYYEQREQMNHHLRSALLYPSVLMLVMLVVIVVLLTQVLPIFNDVYASLGGQMKGIAGHLLHIGQLLNAIFPLLLLLMTVAAIAILAVSSIEKLRNRMFQLFHQKQDSMMRQARFAQALSMTLSSGMNTEDALNTAALLLNDTLLQNCLDLMAQGVSFAESLQKSGLLPPAECRLLSLGMASGNTENVIAEIARRMTQAAENALDERIASIEPVMVVSSSLLVGLILLTVMLPLTRIMSTIG